MLISLNSQQILIGILARTETCTKHWGWSQNRCHSYAYGLVIEQAQWQQLCLVRTQC